MIQRTHFRVHGHPFTFETDEPVTVHLFQRLYHGFEAPPPTQAAHVYGLLRVAPQAGESPRWTLHGPNWASGPLDSLARALLALEALICNKIELHPSSLHAVHAAVLHHPNGDMLISGVSGAGKSTLSLALHARGMQIAGDDLSLLDPATGLLHAVPRCFHLDDNSLSLLSNLGLELPAEGLAHSFVTPFDLRQEPARPARVRFALYLESSRLSKPELLPQTQAQLAASLLSETSRHYGSDLEQTKAIAGLVAGCVCLRVHSGTLRDTTDDIMDLVRSVT